MTTATTPARRVPEGFTLGRGGHSAPGDEPPEELCNNELKAYLAGEPHSAQPACVSPVINSFSLNLNDTLPDDLRQRLIGPAPDYPLAYAGLGTRGDGLDEQRVTIIRRWLMTEALPAWLELAGKDDLAAKSREAAELTGAELRTALLAIRDLSQEARVESRDRFKQQVAVKVREKMQEQKVALVTLDTLVASVALVALDTLDTLVALVALVTLDTLVASVALVTSDTSVTLDTSDTLVTSDTSVTLDTSDTLAALVALVTLDTSDTSDRRPLTQGEKDRIYSHVYRTVRPKIRALIDESDVFAKVRALRDEQLVQAIGVYEQIVLVGREPVQS